MRPADAPAPAPPWQPGTSRANLDSRGAVLFREFWNVGRRRSPEQMGGAVQPGRPDEYPAGVAPAAMPAMLAALRGAADKLQGPASRWTGRLGDYQGDPRNGVRIPLHGGQR